MAHCTFKSDREEDTVMSIRGNYADIDVSIDDDGNVTLL